MTGHRCKTFVSFTHTRKGKRNFSNIMKPNVIKVVGNVIIILTWNLLHNSLLMQEMYEYLVDLHKELFFNEL